MAFEVADGHNDYLYQLLKGNANTVTTAQRLQAGNVKVQVFSLFPGGKGEHEESVANGQSMLDSAHTHLNKLPVTSVLSIEGCEVLGGSMERLHVYYEGGVRMAALTWNHDNLLAGGVAGNGELTAFGRQAVEQFNALGVLIDVSHLNETSFWQVLDCAQRPMASHSCAMALHPHRRNLTDEQIRALTSRGGVIGVNFYPVFAGEGQVWAKDIARHIDHFVQIGGIGCAALGSDFDGIETFPQDLHSPADFGAIAVALSSFGYRFEDIGAVMSGNLTRMLESVGALD